LVATLHHCSSDLSRLVLDPAGVEDLANNVAAGNRGFDAVPVVLPEVGLLIAAAREPHRTA
jgi:hypothetical protein